MNRRTSTNSAIGRRVIARRVLDMPEGTVVPGSATGVIVNVEHHATHPWMRYTVQWDNGTIAEAQVVGKDIKIA